MTPEDVLLEAITIAGKSGDSSELRALMCAKLNKVMRRYFEAVPCDIPHVKEWEQ